MEKKKLLSEYNKKKEEIKNKLEEFKNLPKRAYLREAVFCLLTPQSQAKKCWEAVVQLENFHEEKAISACLSKKTRFHNNKTRYILQLRKNWNNIEEKISEHLKDERIIELRNWLSDNVLGLGLKEASHFLRNIGKSNNQIAILDRHILKNLRELGIIKEIKKIDKKNYLEIEKKFKNFSKEINIPMDELDLLFWSEEEGTIFK